MRQLILLRHAKAAAESETGEDFDRPLAPRGRDDAPLAARALADAGADPTVALVSPARRTRETWDLARPFFPQVQTTYVDDLYDAPAEVLLREAEDAGAERLILVAHNPGLHELASRLAYRNTAMDARVRTKFPTSAGALFTRTDETAPWRLAEFITPRVATE